MDKNNSKTINERTHTSMNPKQKSGTIQNEEFSKDFDSKIDTNNNTANQTNQKSTKSRNKG